mmetsp:Transcript_32600/g.5902  ORF Transcript_32600/g.5902 Transcript_32600/m.5902 type:complete len:89 (-) Transcript_32600:922-1188(-)
MGKPLATSLFEVQKSIDACIWSANHGQAYFEKEMIPDTFDKSYYTIKPKGPILLVTPFNYPFWLTFKMALPNLLLGNTILVKPDENTP